MKKVAFHTLGCKVNQYETQKIAEKFREEGFDIVGDGEIADVYIINTCTVTNVADRKSRQFIRRARRANPKAVIGVTGCYAEINKSGLEEVEGIDVVCGNSDKGDLAVRVMEALRRKGQVDSAAGAGDGETGIAAKPINECGLSALEQNGSDETLSITTGHDRKNQRSRAYIKVEDGCDRFCSYCIIPHARGRVRSRPTEDILKEAEELVAAGKKELILTGINTALYGEDFASKKWQSGKDGTGIAYLIGEILKLPGNFRVRLSSLEPTVVDAGKVQNLFGLDRLCHHLHLSLQSGSDRILSAMNRRYDRKDYLDIVKALRNFDPYYGITTDVIVGFPGETIEDLEDTMDLIRRAEFAKTHVFPYSVRSGTAAAAMDGQLSGKEKTERSRLVLECAEKAAVDFRRKCMGEKAEVLLSEIGKDGCLSGYASNYLKVYVNPKSYTSGGISHDLTNNLVKVELVDLYKDGMKGVLING